MYTSEELEQLELEQLETITESTIQYKLTDDEVKWLMWIGRRYTISSHLIDTIQGDTVTIDSYEIARALSDDGLDRAPCLSDDTQLQRLLWYIGPNQ
jgi:hypothetical protein